MTKLERMQAEYLNAQKARTELEARIPQLEADQEHLAAEADAAAASGDLALYREKKEAAQMAADQVFVIRKQLEAASAYRTLPDAKEAWKEYSEAYGKTFEKAWSAYAKDREALYTSFLALVIGQQAALKIREDLATCCGLDLGDYPGQTLDRTFPLKMIPASFPTGRTMTQLNTPDTDFFVRQFSADLDLFNKVIRLHQTF